LLLVSWIALFWSAFANQGLDAGWSSQNFCYGFARVFYSFILGLVIFSSGIYLRFKVSAACLILMTVLFVFMLQMDMGWVYDLIVITFCFPVILVASVNIEVIGNTRIFAKFIGDISYSVYLLQTPAIILFSGLSMVVLGEKIGVFTPAAGLVFILFFIPCCYLSWRFFEMPSQRAAKTLFLAQKK
jgi:peptidoglycan/LPS O-acetylase OafA/YrhL